MEPRKTEEILQRIQELHEDETADRFGIERSRLLEALPLSDAMPFLEEGADVTPESWEAQRLSRSEAILLKMRGYIRHAWAKANDCREVSALKSMAHFKGLLWLLGEMKLYEWIDEQMEGTPARHPFYGKPALVKISEFLDFNWRDADSGEWFRVTGEDLREAYTADEAISDGALS